MKLDPEDQSLIDYVENLVRETPGAPRGVAWCELWGLVDNNQGEAQLVKISLTERSEHGSLVALCNLLQTVKVAEANFDLHLARNYPEVGAQKTKSHDDKVAVVVPTEEQYIEPDL